MGRSLSHRLGGRGLGCSVGGGFRVVLLEGENEVRAVLDTDAAAEAALVAGDGNANAVAIYGVDTNGGNAWSGVGLHEFAAGNVELHVGDVGNPFVAVGHGKYLGAIAFLSI